MITCKTWMRPRPSCNRKPTHLPLTLSVARQLRSPGHNPLATVVISVFFTAIAPKPSLAVPVLCKKQPLDTTGRTPIITGLLSVHRNIVLFLSNRLKFLLLFPSGARPIRKKTAGPLVHLAYLPPSMTVYTRKEPAHCER